jgi:diacylglycerol O-acyltransferase
MAMQDGEFMRASDAFSWYQEADPALRSTVVAVAWLDRRPNWDALCATMEVATRLAPRFRQRVEEPPARVAPPRWTLDEDFDLSWHLRRVEAPEPHTPEMVLDLARIEAMTGFDHARPLWKFTLVERVGQNRAALVLKMHHALADGQGAMKLAPLLFDQAQAGRPRPLPPKPVADHGGLAVASLVHDVRMAGDLVAGGVRALPALGLSFLRDPIRAVRETIDTVRSIATTVRPVTQTLSPVMRGRGPGRGFEVVAVDLADLKRAATTADATVNDAFLTAVTGGLRRYHQLHDARPATLRVTMPISIRTTTDAAASNRITLMRFPLPVSEADPAVRILLIGRSCREARAQRSLGFTDAIAGGLDLLPTGVVGSLLKRVDFLASDVIGMPDAVYLAGARMTAYCAFGPTMGCAANLTLMSYAGTCFVGVTLDTAAIPDAEVFATCLRDGFTEVLDLASPHSAARLPVREGTYPGTGHTTRNARRQPSMARTIAPGS